MKSDLTVGIVGAGGVGAVTAGAMLIDAAAYEGLYAMNVQSFGPQIRGGESSTKIRMSEDQVLSPGDTCDVLIVFHLSEYPKFRQDLMLNDHTVILYEHDDPLVDQFPFEVKPTQRLLPVPFKRLASEEVKVPQAANVVALGLFAEMFGLSPDGLKKHIQKRFFKKGEAVIASNLKALEVGATYARESFGDLDPSYKLSYTRGEPKLVLTGNDAIGLGAIWAGCRFFAGYPITPSSEIMHFMSQYLPRFGGMMIQTEDEISAICHCIGASYAGKKAMTATSGPGVSLMLEGIGLASMAEIPVVIASVQRGGPSTGLPTKTEQADLLQAVFGTHGDAPKIVLAPADVQDCFDTTVEAFYAAEKYQMPVIILSDQLIGHRYETVTFGDLTGGFVNKGQRLHPGPEDLNPYLRYKDTEDGISPMAIPGMADGMYLASGIEHDEKGSPSAMYSCHKKMTLKRYKKFDAVRRELNYIRHYGPEDAEIGAVGWGSSKGVLKEAVLRLNEEGHKVKAVVPQIIYPPNYAHFDEMVRPLKKFVVFETSWNQQFFKFIRTYYLCDKDQIGTYAIPGGRALTVKEVYDRLKEEL
ncbi:MAG TPA: 2-oxoacid:acceptor oxidoreductase subunit alpha [Thermoanaerobaculia bacterium]|nr:2-oxoacid:acceptor oxidoreductase subunit alpha [Thermoanaerobaculia bacterium]HUM29281.1 2-oxoacid:acceptor oxidoreductase subunit alpha [Thermoanaerobaculia bacterium]HXK67761.1 2-oxoacid:acceptor oxidoreductase subunit alpha [Thermoanaerobaculia bacterium]